MTLVTQLGKSSTLNSSRTAQHHKLTLSVVILGIIVAKASDGQRYLLPLRLCLAVCDGERGSGPEGADDVGF